MKKLRNKTVQDGIAVLALGSALFLYSMYQFFFAKRRPAWVMSPYLFPIIVAVFAIVLGIVLVFQGYREEHGEKENKGTKNRPQAVLFVLGLSIAYDILIRYITFIPATVLFLAVMIGYMGERDLKKWIPISLLTPVVLFLIFQLGLNVKLP